MTDEDLEKLSPSEVVNALGSIQKELDRLKLAVTGGIDTSNGQANQAIESNLKILRDKDGAVQKNELEKTVEGVFDGEQMIGADGQQYDVPANYASKSKLVEGDVLKLSINNMGSFVYKQIKPIDRVRLKGELVQEEQSLQFYAVVDDKKWKLLTASVTYYRGEAGDEVIFLIPAEGSSMWAAVDNIVK